MRTVISWCLSAVVAHFTKIDFFVISSTVLAGMDIYTSWITRPKLGKTDDKMRCIKVQKDIPAITEENDLPSESVQSTHAETHPVS